MATSVPNKHKQQQQQQQQQPPPTPPIITTTNVAAVAGTANAATTAATAAPLPPNLQLLEPRLGGGGAGIGDTDDDDDDDVRRNCNEDMVLSDQGAGSRRPSTASLSRFRSCPQLASVMNVSQDSPGCDMAPMTDAEGNILHTSPVIHNSSNSNNTLQVERPRYEMTSTPTPPSTPGSRRKEIIVTSSHQTKTHTNSNVVSPCSTPKLPRRSTGDRVTDNNLIPRTVSSESYATDGAVSGHEYNSSEKFLRMEDLPFNDSLSKRRSFYGEASQEGDRASDYDDASSMHLCGRYSQQQFQFQHSSDQLNSNMGDTSQQQQHRGSSNLLYPGSEDDSMDKCNRWLQGLKLSKSDKIKSRSHIQLPAL